MLFLCNFWAPNAKIVSIVSTGGTPLPLPPLSGGASKLREAPQTRIMPAFFFRVRRPFLSKKFNQCVSKAPTALTDRQTIGRTDGPRSIRRMHEMDVCVWRKEGSSADRQQFCLLEYWCFLGWLTGWLLGTFHILARQSITSIATKLLWQTTECIRSSSEFYTTLR